MEKRRYRNAVRSKRLIRQAFLELLRERPFEKITVTDLVEKADVNRSTFYAHYPDVMGIIDEIESEIIEFTVKTLSEMEFVDFGENPEKYIKYMMKSLEENGELYRLLRNSNVATRQLEKVKDVIIEKTLEIIRRYDTKTSYEEYVFIIHFLAGGMMEIYTQWICGDSGWTLNDVTEKMTKLVVVVNKELL